MNSHAGCVIPQGLNSLNPDEACPAKMSMSSAYVIFFNLKIFFYIFYETSMEHHSEVNGLGQQLSSGRCENGEESCSLSLASGFNELM